MVVKVTMEISLQECQYPYTLLKNITFIDTFMCVHKLESSNAVMILNGADTHLSSIEQSSNV
jgi:hypothetical protein